MGFIKETLEKDNNKYILLDDIVLFVQSLDSDKPSLSETAKFLLRKYKWVGVDGVPFRDIDDNSYKINLKNEFYKIDVTRPFYHFLEFIAEFDDFECGRTDSGFFTYNEYTDIYLPISSVDFFLKYDCNLKNLPDDLLQTIQNIKYRNTVLSNNENQIEELERQIQKLKSENEYLKTELNKNKKLVDNIQITQIQENQSLEKWQLIQLHQKRAPEFDALIQTLIHFQNEYNSNNQPLKKVVAQVFREKTNMTANERRAEEVARILGLPE